MPRGRSASELSLSERREKATEYFLKGLTVADVAHKLNVTWDTAKGYKRWFEENVRSEAADNPHILSDVITNTFRALASSDQVMAALWKEYHTADSKQLRVQTLNAIRAVQQDKAKLFGLLGIKHEFYAKVQVVNAVQMKLLAFLQSELCEADRRKIDAFLTSPEIMRYMQESDMPLVELGEGDYEEADVV
jgi:hypothetical protein